MKRRPLVAVLAVLALGLSLSPASAADPATLTVNGQGSITQAPDGAIVDVTISTDDPASAAKATDRNNVAYNGLHDRLRALGVRDDAIKTTSLSVRFVPRPASLRQPLSLPPPEPAEHYGYVATRTLAVTAPRVDAAGRVVDAAVGGGAEVEGVRYVLSDEHAARAQALGLAVADAQAQADAVAQAAHLHVTGIKSIDVSGGQAPVAFARTMTLAATPTELTPTPLEVRASVSITYSVGP